MVKLLNFPFDIQEQILQEMHIKQVVLLSFCSSRMKDVIRQARIKVPFFGFCWQKDWKKGFYFRDYGKSVFYWIFHPSLFPRELKPIKKRFDVTVGTNILSTCFSGLEAINCSRGSDIMDACQVAELLMNLFRVPPLELYIDCDKVQYMNQFLAHPVIRTTNNVVVEGGSVDWNTLSMIAESLPALNTLIVNARRITGQLTESNRILTTKSLFFAEGKWLKKQHLPLFESNAVVFIKKSNLKTEDLIQFVKEWMNGRNTSLAAFGVYSSRKLDKEAIRREIPMEPWNPERRGRFFDLGKKILFHVKRKDPHVHGFIDSSLGMDFERADGLLASLLFNRTGFLFCVWHERFPKYPTEWDEMLREREQNRPN